MIYLTGDIHGDPSRFSVENFPIQKEMTKDDFVIILGDFGLVWDYKGENKREKYWLDWLNNKNFTTLFIEGNHSNFDRLNDYPIETWNCGKIHRIRKNIIHLMRGQVFTLQDKKFFTFGGASSHDIRDGILEKDDPRIKIWKNDYEKFFRINKVSWWEQELPTKEEMDEGLENLKINNNKIDYILSHSPCSFVLRLMDHKPYLYKEDMLTKYLFEIKQFVDYKYHYFGHMHDNKNFYEVRSKCLYDQIFKIE